MRREDKDEDIQLMLLAMEASYRRREKWFWVISFLTFILLLLIICR